MFSNSRIYSFRSVCWKFDRRNDRYEMESQKGIRALRAFVYLNPLFISYWIKGLVKWEWVAVAYSTYLSLRTYINVLSDNLTTTIIKRNRVICLQTRLISEECFSIYRCFLCTFHEIYIITYRRGIQSWDRTTTLKSLLSVHRFHFFDLLFIFLSIFRRSNMRAEFGLRASILLVILGIVCAAENYVDYGGTNRSIY